MAVDALVDGSHGAIGTIAREELPRFVAERERTAAPRWVWSDTPAWYPALLEAGVRVARCVDLRLSHAILRRAAAVGDTNELRAAVEWDVAAVVPSPEPRAPTLFDIDRVSADAVPDGINEALAEFARQRSALATAADPARLGFLVAAESAGALAASEMAAAGVPWDVAEHDRLLREVLGSRPRDGGKPERMIELAEVVRAALGDSRANIDSPPKLLRSLKQAGIEVTSTSRWELAQHEHPAVEPLLRYKKMSRLLAANGWNWIDEWVRDGRYRPVYVPGGVVTGRWASSGGGALQLPRQLRPVLRADPGWLLVSADVAQLEPRVLAAMSGDRAMADAGRGKDLYAGVVASGAVSTRDEAKIAVLGAMYGATTGDSGRLVPRLRKGFPAAMRLVDDAAAVGEHGGSVTTWLGRTSPPPGPGWIETQAAASAPNANAPDENRARRVAREFGRFTRNFVVQGTAAEWALVWIAELRTRLAALGETSEAPPADASGVVFARRPHLVFFLHDEIIVHTPAELAPQVVVAVEDSARVAGQRMFGAAPVDFPLDLRVSERAEKG
jgi:DNA polymerase-1